MTTKMMLYAGMMFCFFGTALAQSSSNTQSGNNIQSAPEWPPHLSYDTTGIGDKKAQIVLPGLLHIVIGSVGDPQEVITANGVDLVTLFSIPGETMKVGMTALLSQSLISCPGYDVSFYLGGSGPFDTKPLGPCLKGLVQITVIPSDEEQLAETIHKFGSGPITFRQKNKIVSVWGEGDDQGAIDFARRLHPWGMKDSANPNP